MMLHLMNLTPLFCIHCYDDDSDHADQHRQRIDDLDTANAVTRSRIHRLERERTGW